MTEKVPGPTRTQPTTSETVSPKERGNTVSADAIIRASLQALVRHRIITAEALSQATKAQIEEYTVRCEYTIAAGKFHNGEFIFDEDEELLKTIPHKFSAASTETQTSPPQPTRQQVISATRDCLAVVRENPDHQDPYEVLGLFTYGSRMDPGKTPRAPKIDEAGEVIKEGSDIDTIAIGSNPDGPYPNGDINADLNNALAATHPEFKGIAFHNRGLYGPKAFRRDLELGIPPQISWWFTSSPDAAYYVGTLPEATLYINGKVVTFPPLSEEEINERLSTILHSEAGQRRWEEEVQRSKDYIAAHVKI